MERYNALIWMAGALVLYAALRLLLVLITESIVYRSPRLLISGAASLVPAILVGHICHSEPAIKLLAISAAGMTGLYLTFAISARTIKDWHRIKDRRRWGNKATVHLILATGSIIFMVPFIWLISTSFKEQDQVFTSPPILIPTRQIMMDIAGKPHGLSTMTVDGHTVKVVEVTQQEAGGTIAKILPGQYNSGKTVIARPGELTKIRKFGLRWENYGEALDFLPPDSLKGLIYLWNTVYITLLSIIGTILSSSIVAYSFARLRWPFRDTLFGIMLGTMMLPSAVTMVPVFLVFRALGWIDTLRPLWLPSFFAGAFSVFLLRQFFLTIPTDLEDAAKIDGCSYFVIYSRIMLPLVKPALAALTIMTFMATWNNFMGPLIYISSPEKMPLVYALQMFQGTYAFEYGKVMAASSLVMLPVLLLFFFTQRYFIEGITLTGIKG